MISIKEYIAPDTLSEAYEILMSKKNNTILGGMGFIKMGSKSIGTAIDLCNLDLDYIREDDNSIRIGSNTSLRTLEIDPVINKYFGESLCKGIASIVGVQFRNMAKVGANIFMKHGFSDIIPSLLVLDARLRLFDRGEIELGDFLNQKYEKDILVEIIIPKKPGISVSESIRKSSTDFPIINGAMFRGTDGKFKLAIGSRPKRAKLAPKTAQVLEEGNSIEEAESIILQELTMGSNIRASKEYREDMCKSLLNKMYHKIGDYNDR